MEALGHVDLYATKGLEYLLVLGFLLLFVFFWRFMQSTDRTALATAVARRLTAPLEWFRLEAGRYYHQGHAWARPDGEKTVTVGLDDFAQKLVGTPQAVTLPAVGSRVEQGEEGWRLAIGSKSVAMLSPVSGEVVEVNREVLDSPALLGKDPYEGWLMKVRVPRMRPALRNLLSGELAAAWLQETVTALRQRMSGNLGMVLQDGGMPVSGFAANLSPDAWEEIAAEFFLTN